MLKVQQASRVRSLPARQASASSIFPFQRLTANAHTQVIGSPDPHLPASCPTHLSRGSLSALQSHHGDKQVFISVTDHDRHLAVVHNLFKVKEPIMPHAGKEESQVTGLVSCRARAPEQTSVSTTFWEYLFPFRTTCTSGTDKSYRSTTLASLVLCNWVLLLVQPPHRHPQPLPHQAMLSSLWVPYGLLGPLSKFPMGESVSDHT